MIKDVIKSIATVFSTKCVILVIGFLNSVILARGLGTEGQGQYAVAVTTYTTIFQICCMGIHSAQNYYLSKDRNKLPLILGNSVGISLLCGGLCLIVLMAVNIFIQRKSIAFQIFLVCVLIPFMSYAFLGLTNRLSIKSVLMTLIFSYITADLIGGISFIRMNVKLEISVSFYLECLKMGVQAFTVGFLSFLVLRVDLYMISFYLGDMATGKYSIASNLVDIVNTFCATIVMVMTPKVACIEDYRKRYAIVAKILIGEGVVVSAIGFIGEIFCGWLIPLLFGKQYIDSINIFRILLIGMLFLGVSGVFCFWFWTKKSYKESIVAYGIAVISNLILNFLMIRRFGLMGVAIASMISYIIIFCILGFLFYVERSKLKDYE